MTQTLGQLLVNEILPKGMQVTGPLSKKDLNERLHTLAQADIGDAATKIEKLRRLGHELATLEGVSATLDDITPDYATRNRILDPVLERLQSIDDPEKRRELISRVQPQLLEATKSHPGSFGMMVRSGARGKPIQLAKSVAAPVMALTHTGDPVPWLVHHSYAEGLRNSEAWATHIETRNNQIDTRLAVTEPGDIGKILVNNMTDQLVSEEDCGTSNGIMMALEDGHSMDRYLARQEDGFPRNTLITPQIVNRLRSKKIRDIMVRSPMTCESHEGVCQKCYGLDERGRMQQIGTNIGVRSAQALSEPLTQFALSAKHGVRTTVADAAAVEGHKGLRQLIDVPKSFAHKAALAPEEGRVTKIEVAPQGGHFVYVNDKQVYAPPGYPPIVKKGQNVFAGDAVSDGIPNPAELVGYKGLGAGRNYLVNQLQGIYNRQGLDIDKRHLELLAKTHLNHVRIDSDPEDRFYPGETVDFNAVMSRLSEHSEETPVKEALGKMLGANYGYFTAGTRVTPQVIDELKRAGVKKVMVPKNPPVMTAFMRPTTRNPLLNPDWMARLGHRYLEESLLRGVQFGEESNIHGRHPIPALAYGAEFGQGREGRY